MSAESKSLRNAAAKYLAVARTIINPPEKMSLLQRAADHIRQAIEIDTRGGRQDPGTGLARHPQVFQTPRDGHANRSAERVGSGE